MAERVVQTCCCCCAPTFHPYVVTCNIFVLYCECDRDREEALYKCTDLLTYLLTYISST